jgi:hypothetical protein
MIDWMDGLKPVTEPTERARLARWAVSLRRAHAAGTAQTTGRLALMDDTIADSPEGYCCLGIWCEIEHAAGKIERRDNHSQREFRTPDEFTLWTGSTLPSAVQLAGEDNPDLLRIVLPDQSAGPDPSLEESAAEHGYWLNSAETVPDVDTFVEGESQTLCAADLNDDLGLSFGQIADVVVWRYGLTVEELATAEAAPRVELVEGPAGVAYDGPGTVPF